MEPVEIVVLIVFIAIMAFLTTSGVFLLRRSTFKRDPSNLYLGIFFLSFASMIFSLLAKPFGLNLSYLVAAAVAQAVIFFLLRFVQVTFYIKERIVSATSLLLFVILGACNFIFAYLYDQPATILIGRIGFTLAIDIQFILVATWQTQLSMRDFIRITSISTSAHIRKRYRDLILNSVFMILFPSLDLIGTLVSMSTGIDYFIFVVFLLIDSMVYCIHSFYLWVVYPQRGRSAETASMKDESGIMVIPEMEGDEAVSKILTLGTVMDLIAYFGEILARFIKKDPASCKGLLYMAIVGYLGDDEIYKLTYKKFVSVLNNGLPERLRLLQVEGVDEIISKLVQEADEKKSMFTMM